MEKFEAALSDRAWYEHASAKLARTNHASFSRHSTQTATKIIGRTACVPGLPYVTSMAADPELCRRLRKGLESAFADSALAEVRDALLIDGLDLLPIADYDCMLALRSNAERIGYRELG